MLAEVGCIVEKVGVAKADTSFRLLVTANEVDWEKHHRVLNVRDPVKEFLSNSEVPLSWKRDDCYCRRTIYSGIMRKNREEEGSWWVGVSRFLLL